MYIKTELLMKMLVLKITQLLFTEVQNTSIIN